MKDLLAETVRGVLGEVPWLPLTYNLETQLAAFIADFHGRQEKNEDNVWIVKPWYGPCRQLAARPFPWASPQPTARLHYVTGT